MERKNEIEEMSLSKLEEEIGKSCESRNIDDCYYTGRPCDLNCREGLILGKFKRCLNYEKEQAREETAKEILQEVFGYVGSEQKFCIVNDDHRTLIDVDKLFEFLAKLAEKHGVEVPQ